MAAFQDPLHPTEEERKAVAERLQAIRNNRTGTTTVTGHGTSRRKKGNIAENLEVIKARVEEIQRQNAERRMFEERRREAERAAFTGNCFECRDRGPCIHCERGMAVYHEMEAVHKRERVAELLQDLTPRMQRFSLSSYPQKNIPAYKEICDFLLRWDEHRGLFLVGSYGNGKTGLMVGLIREIAGLWYNTSHRIMVMTGPDLMQFLRSGFNADRKDDYEHRLQRVKDVRLLAIDDIGAESTTPWVQEQLFAIINHRYEHMLPVFVTTNYGGKQLGDKVGPRVLERLTEMCDPIVVSGRNLRTGRGN